MNPQFNHRKQALGHDAPHMATLLAEAKRLQDLIASTRSFVLSDEAVRCVRELDETLAEAVHDCSLVYVRDLCAAGGDL